MKKKLSTKETVLLVFLVVLLVGVGYYMFFYTPLQEELERIDNQSIETDSQIQIATAKVESMNKMQSELDEIFSSSGKEVTEIAAYDNKKVVMKELYSILAGTDSSITFSDPKIDSSGIVRRTISLSFTCPSYSVAKSIIRNLTNSRWRCLVTDYSINGDGDITDGEVKCTATIVYFESTKLTED